MFWNKKEQCVHEWKVYDFRIMPVFRSISDEKYYLVCSKCKKQRDVDSYEYNKMKSKGFIKE